MREFIGSFNVIYHQLCVAGCLFAFLPRAVGGAGYRQDQQLGKQVVIFSHLLFFLGAETAINRDLRNITGHTDHPSRSFYSRLAVAAPPQGNGCRSAGSDYAINLHGSSGFIRGI